MHAKLVCNIYNVFNALRGQVDLTYITKADNLVQCFRFNEIQMEFSLML